jgi:hypothetical protein
MTTQREVRRRCGPPAVFLGAVILLAGCATTTPKQAGPGEVDNQAFIDHLTLTAQAINAGDLDKAKARLGRARAATVTPQDVQKVDGLEYLIVGAEALRSGDPESARTAWGKIEEPHLRREVRYKARLIGLEVPILSVEEGAMP